MSQSPIPRILIVDDLFGRAHPDSRNVQRANLCGQYLIQDVTGDEVGKGIPQEIANPVAQAVFYRGQKPACSIVGDVVENDLNGTLEIIRSGWSQAGDGPCWAMVLLDLCFYTGRVTEESNRKRLGMPKGREEEDDPKGYFGLRILQAIQDEMPDLPVIILSSMPREDVSLEFTNKGARAFIPRDKGDPGVLKDYLQRHGLIPDERGIIIGRSRSLLLALREARRVAGSNQNVLIRGEAGTGKELFASFIHHTSPRADKTFEVVSLPAIPTTLAEDALFGHVKGAFYGAQGDNANRSGAFEKAHKGTLFLDEIGDTPQEVQPKLLRVIQNGEVQRLGTDRIIKVDVRVLSATNVDIESHVVTGAGFRRDLLDRLRTGGTILLPPLRYRKEDISLLAEKFVKEAQDANPLALPRDLDPDALEKLRNHDWPGNIRELRQVIFEAVNKYPDVEHLVTVHINLSKWQAPAVSATLAVAHRLEAPEENRTLKETDLSELMQALETFEFDPAKPEELIGKLPQIQGAFARLLARYLESALKANTQNRTPENPRGEVRIQPTINMMVNDRNYSKVSGSKAADIVKSILNTSEEAIRILLEDPEHSILNEALDKALSLRPKKRKLDENQQAQTNS